MNLSEVNSRLRQNLEKVRDRISSACVRAGRSVDEVQLVAVTKYVSAEVASLILESGVTHWGENRPQALWEKARQVRGVHWHLIGHLQRNKVAQTLPFVELIHSVDSDRLLQAIETEAQKQSKVIDVLLEIHLSGEESKQGFSPEEVFPLIEIWNQLKSVRIMGLMTMSALGSTSEDSRKVFSQLRQLRDAWSPEFQAPHQLRQLSMGMTSDFEQAVEEGATLVRIGSALFEGLS